MTKTLLGQKIPKFSLKNDRGEEIAITDFRGKYVLLYFYPRDNTPGCTREACDLRDNIGKFSRQDAVVVGISPDSEKSHEKFRKDHELPFVLLSDPERKVVRMFGVYKQKLMYGKKVWGIERSTFLISPTGKLLAEKRKVNVDGHVEEMLEILNSLTCGK